jgi:ABC-type transport system involved in cytochrome bd biosynthesis fused ATPase/permease subunit
VSAQAKVTGRAPTAPVRRSGPFDPRLLRYARTTRRFVVLSVLIGGVTALLVVAQAWLIATIANDAFFHHGSLSSLRTPLIFLLAVIVGRAVLAWATERAAHRASASAKSELRCSAAAHIAAMGPAGLDHQDRGRLSVLVTTGIDALDGYFSRYLPQLFLAVIVPVTIIGVVAGADPISAVLIAVTVPLIPVFMGLVGLTTRDRTAARMRSLHRLAGHFLDVVAGLPTLKVFGRAKAQARAIADVTDRYRVTTLATLKLTFLSSLVLELLATISVALVAVAVGLRLLDADMHFHAALFVLVLAPEAYLPLRALGANFHASADGMKAAEQIFELLETSVGDELGVGTVLPKDTSIAIVGLEVTYPGRRIPAVRGPTSWSSPVRWWHSPASAAVASRRCSTSSWACAALTRDRSCSAGWTWAISIWTPGAPESAGYHSAHTCLPAPWPTTSASAAPTPPTPTWRRPSRRPD